MRRYPAMIEYTDFSDDFANNGIHAKKITADFPFEHKNPLWRLGSFLLRYLIAYPIVAVVCRVWYGVRFENRKALRRIRGTCYIYANHTQNLDVFAANLVGFPKPTYIIAGPDAVSIPGLRNIVQMLGGVPLPSEFAAMRPFLHTVETLNRKGCHITIYPEAHIWPYYTKIRPFSDASFTYPVKASCPAIAMVTTYRRGLLYPLTHRPSWTVVLSDPVYPDVTLPRREAIRTMHDEIYRSMIQIASTHEQVSYIRYRKKEQDHTDTEVDEPCRKKEG